MNHNTGFEKIARMRRVASVKQQVRPKVTAVWVDELAEDGPVELDGVQYRTSPTTGKKRPVKPKVRR